LRMFFLYSTNKKQGSDKIGRHKPASATCRNG
jgi:hypothetical protein